MKPSVSVVVFNYNGKHYLKECFDALFMQTYTDFETIFVDDASTDRSVEFVRQHYPHVKIIALKENVGIAESTNRGFAAASGTYIVSLHNDAVPAKDWLQQFVDAMEAAPDVACMEGEVNHFSGAGVLNASLNVACSNTLNAFSDLTKKFYAGTCSMIIRNGILERYCDPDYYFYSEDVYLGWLLRLLGYDIKRNPAAKVMHHGTVSATSKERKKQYQFLSERNRMMNFFTFFETKTILKLFPLLCFFTQIIVMNDIGKNSWKVIPKLRAYWWITRHFKTVLKKRKLIQQQRKVSDTVILKEITYKLLPEKTKAGKTLNAFSRIYCQLVGIKTAEFYT